MHTLARRQFILILMLCFLALSISACKVDRKRPYGYVRLGYLTPLIESDEKQIYLNEHNLLLRRDVRGFSAMSTACTYDVSKLKLVKKANKEFWQSVYTASEYDSIGNVLHGPAQAPLPYYELVIAPFHAKDPELTLYAKIGKRVDREWRLPVTKELLTKARNSQSKKSQS